jgi:hypothetical protein
MTFALELEDHLVALAREEAEARHTNLHDVVAHLLRAMAANREQSRAGETPIADELRGCLSSIPEGKGRVSVEEALGAKYGDI